MTSEPPTALNELREGVPQAMLDVIARCLARDPDARYANAADLAEGLEPLAPAEAHATIERARLAVGHAKRASGPRLLTPLPAPAPTPVPTPESPLRDTPRIALTPAAWDSGKAESPPPSGKPRSSLRVVAAIGASVVAAMTIGTVVMLRTHDESPPRPPVAASPPATTVPAAPSAQAAATPSASSAPAVIPAAATPPPVTLLPVPGKSWAPAGVAAPTPAGRSAAPPASTAPPASAAPAASAAPPPSPPPQINCNPPYVIDSAGNHQYKPECL